MAYYLTALNLAFFVSVLLVVRRFRRRSFGPTPRRLSVPAKSNCAKPESLMDRLRDWAFPKLPMV
ncbi:MAG: hypothetical protein PVG78_16660 [Desulfobacterales bacterium]